jgi:sigma-B regulation protein RsbU (phosphoserine phosphatase)
VGIVPDTTYRSQRVTVPAGSRLYLYSDGAYELVTPDGQMLLMEGLQEIIAGVTKRNGPQTAEILGLIRRKQGKVEFKDDVSLLEVAFLE